MMQQCQQTPHAAAPLVVGMGREGLLPWGWEERVDPRSGKTYYQNHFQQTTTWKRPTVAATTTETGAKEAARNDLTGARGHEPPAPGVEEDAPQESLPPSPQTSSILPPACQAEVQGLLQKAAAKKADLQKKFQEASCVANAAGDMRDGDKRAGSEYNLPGPEAVLSFLKLLDSFVPDGPVCIALLNDYGQKAALTIDYTHLLEGQGDGKSAAGICTGTHSQTCACCDFIQERYWHNDV
jgi:hypothetical protein